MRMILLTFTFLFSLSLNADEISGKENWFDQGLKAYQTKNWDQARDNFEKALQFQPHEASIMFNLGLAYFQLNKKGYAVGYWRKALVFSPSFPGATEALEMIQEKYHFARLEKSPWAIAIHDTLTRFGWNFWLGILAVLTASVGWFWLSYFQKRKAAMASDNETPGLSWSLIVGTVLFLFASASSAAKWWDGQKTRGTVVTSSAELKSAPTNDGVTLAPLPEAAEIFILRAHEDWFQVNTGEGSGGWVKKTDVLAASKEF